MYTINPLRDKHLISQLTTLWEESVCASHHFLTPDDIEKLIPFVKEGLAAIETLIVKYDANTPIAFMGIESHKIEMLFVAPPYFGKGIGKTLVQYAITHFEVSYVDVNEQNPSAAAFYNRLGFSTFERTDYDDQGNPFPILRMKLTPFYLRKASIQDISEIMGLFRNTVLTTNLSDYSVEEANDWASCGADPQQWIQTLETHHFTVAINKDSHIVGFASITPKGYLDHIFVHHDFQKRGIATLLLSEAENYAKSHNIYEVTSEVSITALPFFEKRGYSIINKQQRKANKLSLTNYKLAKVFSI